jgi:hypothetical protein
VAGGLVTTELRGGMALLVSLFRNAPLGSEQDIVVKDAEGREQYREGPYNNITVQRPLRLMVSEIGTIGLEEFLKRKRIENSQLGPVSAPSGWFTFPDLAYLRAWLGTIFNRGKND